MTEDALARLLAGGFIGPDTERPLAAPVRAVVIADSLAGREADLVAGLELGRRVARSLARIGAVESVVLPERPRADLEAVERLRRTTTDADALIAVGSGTLNDLCKYASAHDGEPYAVFGTAPSMNGYTAANAAITVGGHKRSLPARVPAGVFLDLKVLAKAPVRLIRAGLGDSLCRPTAQADLLLAHLLLGRFYRRAPFALLAADETALFSAPEALVAGELDAVRRLARTVVLSGLGMTICGSSAPASQGEHLISHYVDMMGDAA